MPLLRKTLTVDKGTTFRSNNPAGFAGSVAYLAVGKEGAGEPWWSLIDWKDEWGPAPPTSPRVPPTGPVVIVENIWLFVRNSPPIEMSQGRGATPRIRVNAITKPWSESPAGPVTLPTLAALEVVSPVLAVADGAWSRIDVKDLIMPRAPETVDGGGGLPFYGLALTPYADAAEAYSTEFYSDDSDSPPYILLEYWDNHPPKPPKNVRPTDGQRVDTATGTEVTISGELDDVDADASISRAWVQIFPAGTTDAQANSGAVGPVKSRSIARSSSIGTPDDLVTAVAFSFRFTGLDHEEDYDQRSRTQDEKLDWGDWTSLKDGRFTTNATPELIQVVVNAEGTLLPHAFGSIRDADPGAYITRVHWRAYEDVTVAGVKKRVTMWDQEIQIGGVSTRFDIVYGGDPLAFAHSYQGDLRIMDNRGKWSDRVAAPFGPREIKGPSNPTPRNTDTKINTLTPALRLEHSSPFDRWQEQLVSKDDGTGVIHDTDEVALAVTAKTITTSSVANPSVITTSAAHSLTSGDTVLIAGHAGSTPAINGLHVVTVISGTTFSIPVNVTVGGTGGSATQVSTSWVVPASKLAWGMGANGDLFRRIRIRITATGVWTEYSEAYPIYVNSLPTTPEVTFPEAEATGTQRADGVWINPDVSVVIRTPFVDADEERYAEVPTRKEVEVRTSATPEGSGALVGGYPVVTTSGIVEDHALAGLVNTTYDVRVAYRDAAGIDVWSSWRQVKASALPTATVTSPVAGTLTDPTPPWAVTFASSAGTAQRDALLRVYENALSTYRQAVIDSGTNSYWRMGATGSPTEIVDEKSAFHGGGTNAIVHGSPTFGVAGLVANDTDKAVTLDGVAANGFEVPAHADYAGWSAISVGGLIVPTATSGTHCFYRRGLGTDSTVLFYQGSATAPTTARILWRPGVTSQVWQLAYTVDLNDGHPHTVLGTYGAVYGARIYLDGVPVATQALIGPLSVQADPREWIGTSGLAGDGWLGTLDEVAKWKGEVGPAKALELHSIAMGAFATRALVREILAEDTTKGGQIPPETFRQGMPYDIEVTVTDEDGLEGTSAAVEVTTDFATPVRPGLYARDQYGRVVVDGLDDADVGGAYTLSGTAADFDVDGEVASVALTAAPQVKAAALLGVEALNVDHVWRVRTDKVPVGGNVLLAPTVRQDSILNDLYRSSVTITASTGAVGIGITKVVAGVATTLASTPSVPRETWVADTDFFIRLKAVGDGTTTSLYAKVWRAGTPGPEAWDTEITDTEATLQDAGGVGMRMATGAGISNLPILVKWVDLESNDALLAATPDVDGSFVTLDWTGTTLTEFRHYRRAGSGPEERIDSGNVTVGPLVDTRAVEGEPLHYSIVNYDGRLGPGGESEPAALDTILAVYGRWLIHDPAVPGLIYVLPDVTAFSDEQPLDWEELEADGRSYPIVETGTLRGPRGGIDILLHERDDWELVRALRSLSKQLVGIKTPYGQSYVGRIRPGVLSPDRHEQQSFRIVYVATERA